MYGIEEASIGHSTCKEDGDRDQDADPMRARGAALLYFMLISLHVHHQKTDVSSFSEI
jgi:hypothetical protein